MGQNPREPAAFELFERSTGLVEFVDARSALDMIFGDLIDLLEGDPIIGQAQMR